MARKKKRSSKTRIPKVRTIKRWFYFCGFIFFALFGSYFLPGKVIRVHDGDTVTVMNSSGSVEKIRLYGIDAPESNQPWGEEATAFTNKVALLEKANIQSMYTDPYGRTVGIVHLEGKTALNQLLVEQGHAWVAERYCKIPQCIQWKIAESKAKKAKKGLWSSPRPIPPWRWRDNNRR